MCRCRCSSLANRRWQCGHGNVLVLVAEAFLLTRDPLVDWEFSIAKLAIELSIDGEKSVELKAGDGWSCLPPLCRTSKRQLFGAKRPREQDCPACTSLPL